MIKNSHDQLRGREFQSHDLKAYQKFLLIGFFIVSWRPKNVRTKKDDHIGIVQESSRMASRLPALTCHDYPTAYLQEQAGIDMIWWVIAWA